MSNNTVLSAVFLFTSVILVAQTSITIYNYNKNKQAKDLNFYWSCIVLVFAIIGLLASGYMLFKSRGSGDGAASNGAAGAAAVTNGGEGGLQGSVEAVANQARAAANAATARAAAATNAAKAIGVLKNTGVSV